MNEPIDRINAAFEPLFESWMDEKDRYEFLTELLTYIGETVSSINEKIKIGEINGYSLDEQVRLLKNLIK